MSKITNIIRRAVMKLKGVPGPLRNAQRYRDRGVEIGEGTYVYNNVHISISKGDKVSIGKNCVLTGCTVIAHDASLKRQIGRVLFAPVVIEDDCFIGFNATILRGVTIGKGAIVGAGAVVTKDVPAGSVVVGNPAQVICTVDKLVEKYSASLEP